MPTAPVSPTPSLHLPVFLLHLFSQHAPQLSLGLPSPTQPARTSAPCVPRPLLCTSLPHGRPFLSSSRSLLLPRTASPPVPLLFPELYSHPPSPWIPWGLSSTQRQECPLFPSSIIMPSSPLSPPLLSFPAAGLHTAPHSAMHSSSPGSLRVPPLLLQPLSTLPSSDSHLSSPLHTLPTSLLPDCAQALASLLKLGSLPPRACPSR